MSVMLANCRVLLAGKLVDATIEVRGDRIGAILGPRPTDADGVVDLGGAMLAPGFVDIQVNGGGGALFNDSPTREGLRTIVAAHRRFGTTSLLPTFITGEEESLRAAIRAVDEAVAEGEPGVAGIHLEGPFLNPLRAGVHDASLMRRMRPEDAELYPRSRPGFAVVVTVAPEMLDPGCVAALRARGVAVASGHTNADVAVAAAGFRDGIAGATHLFNAMSGVEARRPGMVGAALADDDVWVSLIADGNHVDPVNLRVAWRAKPPGKAILITDAMPPVGGSGRRFQVGPHSAEVRDGRCVTEDGRLAGAYLDMASAVRTMVHSVGVPVEQALAMASTNPADAVGLADRGRIAPGKRADLVVLSDALEVVATFVGGVPDRPGVTNGARHRLSHPRNPCKSADCSE